MSNTSPTFDDSDTNEHHFISDPIQRRSFFRYAGFSAAGLAMMASGCKIPLKATGYNLGSSDLAVLNLAYAFEQMEAAFYTQVTDKFYAGASEMEKDLITDIRNNEIAPVSYTHLTLPTKRIV